MTFQGELAGLSGLTYSYLLFPHHVHSVDMNGQWPILPLIIFPKLVLSGSDWFWNIIDELKYKFAKISKTEWFSHWIS